MENIDFGILFQGIGTMIESGWFLACARVFLILLGFLLIYLGWKGILEPMVMIPMAPLFKKAKRCKSLNFKEVRGFSFSKNRQN